MQILQEHADSLIQEVLFRWRGMNIFAVTTLGPDGKRYLTLRPANVGDAAPTTVGTSATWIISAEDVGRSDAGASTISDGPVRNATETATCEFCGRLVSVQRACLDCMNRF